MRLKTYINIAIATTLILLSCTREEDLCLQSTTNPCQLGLYTYLLDSTGTPKKTSVSLEATSVVVSTHLGLDTVQNWVQASTLQIPLDPFADSILALIYTDSVVLTPDSIMFYYQRKDIFVDIACGIAKHYTLDSVIPANRFQIDSTNIINPSLILNNTDENVQIIL